MATEVLLITEQKIKDITVVSGNVDTQFIRPAIILCQDTYIQPIIGSELFKQIQSQVADFSIAGDNKNLLDDYIQKALAWYVVSELPMISSYPLTNKGVQQRNSDNAQAPGVEEILKVSRMYRDKAEFYGERIRVHLLQNLILFPLYRDFSANPIEAIRPSQTPYQSPFNLDIHPEYRKSFEERYQGRFGTCDDC